MAEVESTTSVTDTPKTDEAKQVAPVKTETDNNPVDQSKPAENVQEPVKDKAIDAYELKAGEDSYLDDEQVKAVESYAKDKKLTKEQAEEILNRENAAVKSFYEKQHQQFKTAQEQWVEEIKKDPELGGDNFSKNAEFAKRAVEKFATPKFKEQLEQSGYGNHPELVRVFARIGKLISDDKMVTPGTSVSGSRSYEEIFYGKK